MLDHVGVLWDNEGNPKSLQLAASSPEAKKVLAAFDGKMAYLSKVRSGQYKGHYVLMIPPPKCVTEMPEKRKAKKKV